MTAQITDTYTYHGDEYSIVALTKDIEFDPEKYGFHPTAPHTACWRGYWCEFNITDGHLILDTLHVNQEDLEYPIFRGVAPRFRDSKWDHMAIYSGLNFTIDYTGSIILGKGFLDNYYIHMGYQRAWAYENVIELVLEHGSVVKQVDHSQMVASIRCEIENDPDGFEEKLHSDISKFVNDSFSLEAGIKAWWI